MGEQGLFYHHNREWAAMAGFEEKSVCTNTHLTFIIYIDIALVLGSGQWNATAETWVLIQHENRILYYITAKDVSAINCDW